MTTTGFWSQYKEASLNWIAFGLLLAAWNACDSDPLPAAAADRPVPLRGYAYVTVRAAAGHRSVIKAST